MKYKNKFASNLRVGYRRCALVLALYSLLSRYISVKLMGRINVFKCQVYESVLPIMGL